MKKILFYLVLVLIVSASCGRKTAPEAPEARAAKAVTEFTAAANSKGILLNWKGPTQNLKDDDLLELDSYVIKRREYKLAQETEYEEIAEIISQNKENYTYLDNKIENGKTYDYIILAINDEGVDGLVDAFIRVIFKADQSTVSVAPYVVQEEK